MSPARQWLGSIAYTPLLFLSAGIYASIVVVMSLFGPKFAWRWVMQWVNLALGGLKWFCGLGISIEGSENIPDEPGIAYIKHSSALETIVGMRMFPRQTWVLKRELLWAPLFGLGLLVLRPVAINRKSLSNAVNQVVEQGTQRLASGRWLIIFPEGTRVPLGETKRYGVSGALLASKTGCPLIPVAHNAAEFWPRRGWLKRPGTVRFVIGKPIPTKDRQPRDINAEAQAWIESTIASMH
jgi:1-acyl-sn-glycerol-3-phosphate acyltransferase